MRSRFLQPLVRILLVIGLATAASLGHAGEPRATWCADRCDAVVTDWSLAAYQIIRAAEGYKDPMAASRSLAMMHAAIHDAVNTARPRYRRYALNATPSASGNADAAVAAAVAAHGVLVTLYPQSQAAALTKAELEKTMLEAGVGPAIDAGTRVGEAAAAAVLAKRANDGSAGSEPYVQGTRPGQYRFTPPFDFAAAPHWRNVTPFALSSPAGEVSYETDGARYATVARSFDGSSHDAGEEVVIDRIEDGIVYVEAWALVEQRL